MPEPHAIRATLMGRLWERHKNPLSWALRPIFGAMLFYGAWRHSWLLIAGALIGLATSWCWFPPPARTPPWVERFIDIERRYLTPPWTISKILGIVAVVGFVIVTVMAFWRRDVALGLCIVIAGAIAKAIWSVLVARSAGIPAAIIGIVTAAAAGAILYAVVLAR